MRGREHLVVHRSGQELYLQHTKFKTKKQRRADHVVFCIAAITIS